MGTFDKDELEYLKKKTRLRRKEKKELLELEIATIQALKHFYAVEHTTLGLDLSNVDELEYKYRLNAMQRKLCGLYLDSGSRIGLLEFTKRYIADDMDSIRKEEERKQGRR